MPCTTLPRWGISNSFTACSPAASTSTPETRRGTPLLHQAASKGHVLAAQLLLAHGAQVDIRNDHGATALLEAAAADHELTAIVLIEWGADVNVAAPVQRKPLYTPLHFAARHDSARLVRALIAKGADPDAGDPITVRPVILAMQENRRKTVQVLVEAGAQISAPVAAYLHDRVRLKAAIERGDDVNARVSQDRTGLHLAAEFGDAEMASLLVSHGADFHARDADGYTPLHSAALSGNEEVARVLVAAGADVDANEPDWGYTPLHIQRLKGTMM